MCTTLIKQRSHELSSILKENNETMKTAGPLRKIGIDFGLGGDKKWRVKE